MVAGDLHDVTHGAGLAVGVDSVDEPRVRTDGGRDRLWIEVVGSGIDVDRHRGGAGQHDGVGFARAGVDGH